MYKIGNIYTVKAKGFFDGQVGRIKITSYDPRTERYKFDIVSGIICSSTYGESDFQKGSLFDDWIVSDKINFK